MSEKRKSVVIITSQVKADIFKIDLISCMHFSLPLLLATLIFQSLFLSCIFQVADLARSDFFFLDLTELALLNCTFFLLKATAAKSICFANTSVSLLFLWNSVVPIISGIVRWFDFRRLFSLLLF